MTAGDKAYRGLAVPLYGNFEIIGIHSTNDIMTITAAGTGDFINCQTSAGTATFTVEDDGKIVGAAGAEIACLLAAAKALTVGAGDVTVTAGDVVITNDYFLRFTSWPTTVPITGLTLGDVFLLKISDTIVSVGVAVDGANTVRYLHTTSG